MFTQKTAVEGSFDDAISFYATSKEEVAKEHFEVVQKN